MSIKDIIVHLTPEAVSRPTGSIAYAINMAGQLSAHVTALVFTFDFIKPATFYGGATDEDIAEARENFHRAAEEATATFSVYAARAGISYETAIEETLADDAPQIMNDYAKLRDLVICGNEQTGVTRRQGHRRVRTFRIGATGHRGTTKLRSPIRLRSDIGCLGL